MKIYDILKSKQEKKYEHVCRKRVDYFVKKEEEPEEFTKQYNNVLNQYRKLLDNLGMKMPIPKWEHIKDEPKTWAYSKAITGTNRGEEFVKKWVVNPDFAFKQLL